VIGVGAAQEVRKSDEKRVMSKKVRALSCRLQVACCGLQNMVFSEYVGARITQSSLSALIRFFGLVRHQILKSWQQNHKVHLHGLQISQRRPNSWICNCDFPALARHQCLSHTVLRSVQGRCTCNQRKYRQEGQAIAPPSWVRSCNFPGLARQGRQSSCSLFYILFLNIPCLG